MKYGLIDGKILTITPNYEEGKEFLDYMKEKYNQTILDKMDKNQIHFEFFEYFNNENEMIEKLEELGGNKYSYKASLESKFYQYILNSLKSK